MPRVARAVIEGLPYHVTQRGNRREDVFFEDSDRSNYLRLLGEYADKHGLKVWAYCLMTNHVHLIVVPEKKDSLEKALRPLHMRYAQYINATNGWAGHLWQGRFFSSAMDEVYLRTAVRYVENNPVRAGIVDCAEDYRWSSAPSHCDKSRDNVLSAGLPFEDDVKDWSKWLGQTDGSKEIDRLRRNTVKGLPCGSEDFISRLEGLLERPLRYRPPGRPAKGNK